MKTSHIYPWKREKGDIGLLSDQEFTIQNNISFGINAFISEDAMVDTQQLVFGSNSYIASFAMIRGTIAIGIDCSINAFSHIAGKVLIGNGVRIATHVNIMGFNHGFSDIQIPIHKQVHTFKGIEIKDGVWIGANAVLLDGVTIGEHSIIGAGAVVTKSFPAFSVIGGNPAKIIKMRNNSAESLKKKVSQFNQAYTADWQEIIQQNRINLNNQWMYFEANPEKINKRALCDAVEIAASFDGLPSGEEKKDILYKIQAMQDKASGLCIATKKVDGNIANYLEKENTYYPSMSAFYALKSIGEEPLHPISFLETCSAEKVLKRLESLTWTSNAWGAGAWVDEFLTLCYFQNICFENKMDVSFIFDWLNTKAKPHTGLWGDDTIEKGWLLPINGFYRLTRGSYSQFKKPLPYPHQTIDTIFTHIEQYEFLLGKNFTACNILDVVHPLWLCAKQSDNRKNEIHIFMEKILELILNNYVSKKGFAFATNQTPSLMGTEMWASIIYIICDYLDLAKQLSYQPKGIHLL